MENKRIQVTVGFGSKLFTALLWILFIFPGIIFLCRKNKVKAYLDESKKNLEKEYSTIINYFEQRESILDNLIFEINKQIYFAKSSFSEINKDTYLSDKCQYINLLSTDIKEFIKEHKELQNNTIISTLLEQDKSLYKELIAIADSYNNEVSKWNKDIFSWPTKKIVSAKYGYKTECNFNLYLGMNEKKIPGRLN